MAQFRKSIPIGTSSELNSTLKVKLIARLQNNNPHPKDSMDFKQRFIASPKSVKYSMDGSKFYVQSLEGYNTSVYDAKTFAFKKIIWYDFDWKNKKLFKNDENSCFDYSYTMDRPDYNKFLGKPVESCFSHGGRYLWVSFYRRSYDPQAINPSAVAIIDTKIDKIVRVMPCGPLPKMLSVSSDGKLLAITHWGDNAVAFVDIDHKNPMDFKYLKRVYIGYKPKNDFQAKFVNRDQQCGYCLRGTVFTPDNKYLLVGKMGGGGIAVIRLNDFKYMGNIYGNGNNLRHLVIDENNLYLSTNNNAMVLKANWKDMLQYFLQDSNQRTCYYKGFQGLKIGKGVRTICLSSNHKYLFAAVSNTSKIVVVDAQSMKKITSIDADSYPVGMALSKDDSQLIVTAQGKQRKGGNSVMIYHIDYAQGIEVLPYFLYPHIPNVLHQIILAYLLENKSLI